MKQITILSDLLLQQVFLFLAYMSIQQYFIIDLTHRRVYAFGDLNTARERLKAMRAVYVSQWQARTEEEYEMARDYAEVDIQLIRIFVPISSIFRWHFIPPSGIISISSNNQETNHDLSEMREAHPQIS